MEKTSKEVRDTTSEAIQSLSEAQRAMMASLLAQKRNSRTRTLLVAVCWMLLGLLAGILIIDYQLGREFRQILQGYAGELHCKNAGGQIYDQDGGRICAILIKE